ncbi:MAG: rRNA maturation RNase YbeY [Rubrobacter sp.]|nr:rRNA maturation RNase YbeY [Rubrobacter sp.]
MDRLGELSVALVDLERMQSLNFEFRSMEAPTDVLSFTVDGPYGEMVGEIVISPGYVDGDEAEIEELVVHGALHLCGMDHGEEFEASEMSRAQRAVLEKVREEG